jgi:hypothetical protein
MDEDTHTGPDGTRPERTLAKRANMPPTAGPPDLFPPELVHLLSTARQVIDQHLNAGGTCARCGSAWPCQRARLAEFALGAL